jgi:SAM-dependent methyltransferase
VSGPDGGAARVTGVRVDDVGIHLTTDGDHLCNLQFDGRRIWSFWTGRDGEPEDAGRLVRWPERLALHLEGTTQVTIRLGDGEAVFDEEATFGTEERRLTVVDRLGAPLGIDNYGRLVKTFETRDEGQLVPLLDALETVLGLLRAEGLEAFPAYGTLLGAVRDGAFIGHDSDADVGYVSRHVHPVDVIRESHRVQRAIQRQGYPTTRYSGAAFKIDVPDADGSVRGLDVFGGFFIDGRLALMGEVWEPFEREWIFPLGTVELEGRTLPAPARPEPLLAAMYGEGWRVPDPAFKFEKSAEAQRRFDAWFRGTRFNRPAWDHRYGLARLLPPYQPPHDLARHVHEREEPGTWVLDVGCGRGRDVRWLAKQGRPAVGLDYSDVAMAFVRDRAAEQGWPAELRTMNLLELRQVLAWGALLADRPGPRAVLARHVLDSTSRHGVENFWRLVSMVLSGGGRLHLEVLTAPIEDAEGRPPLTQPMDPDAVVADVERRGARVLARHDLVGEPIDYGYGEEMSQGKQWRSCRLEVEWR